MERQPGRSAAACRSVAWDVLEEMLFYRTKPEEREAHYVNGTGKTITVGVAKIRHADKGGKATIIGSIIPEAIKK